LIKHKHWPSTRRPQPKPGCVTQSSNIANPEEFEMTYREVEMNIIQWGEDRGIVQNATAMSQAIKTLEETTELLDALNKQNIDEAKDAIGDIVVTLIMVCAVLNLDLVQCLNGAYNEIKDRKGYLTKEGVFVKEV
jgi:NTP pyrophosphatase (non-canonical NTP hydrolase)